ncbi:hypothetical protein HAX54_026907 [Datura stramonium]|uniref:Uncharacterized protein n=1 Tax=Datura stramonium TaxID=4076 RepID=A0ABS8V315_DATST|nr:hypothetical protein [Datura stramonium]
MVFSCCQRFEQWQIDGECLIGIDQVMVFRVQVYRGRGTCRCLGCATGSSGEVGIGEHSPLGWAYHLDALQLSAWALGYPKVYRGHDNWYTRGASIPGPLVLGKGPLNALTPTPDMDRTVSRRSELQLTVTLSVERRPFHSALSDHFKADFRPCSTGGSCSQAPSALCTRGPISVRLEETFARLRYFGEAYAS